MTDVIPAEIAKNPILSGPLPDGARDVLTAARKVLSEQGVGAFTLQRVADLAGVNKAAIWYYFGSKQGLLQAISYEGYVQNLTSLRGEVPVDLPVSERIDLFIDQARKALTDPEYWAGALELLALQLHDPELRQIEIDHYQFWYGAIRTRFGVVADDEQVAGHVRVTAALLDGLFLQSRLDPDSFPLEPALTAMRLCLESIFKDMGANGTP